MGLPSSSGLSLDETIALWDESDSLTFVHGDGILVWLGAIENTTLQTLLETSFGISTTELATLLGWLGSFITDRVPQLLEYETGHTVPELAQLAFYEQWANGTIQGETLLPDGFLAELDPPILGPPYFEVGLTEGATGLTVSQVEVLWDNLSQYCLVSQFGINNWYNAKTDTSAYDNLKFGISGITDAQMEAILNWLPKFRDVIVNKLGQSELGLPMEPLALGNTLFLGLASGGGLLALIGVVLLVLARRK